MTEKLFIGDKYLKSCEAEILQISDDGIVTNRTIAFPEGGGQIGDSGTIRFKDHEFKFFDTRQAGGRMLFINDFPSINVDTKIYHKIEDSNINILKTGDRVILAIDVEKRMASMALHSALHLVIMSACKMRRNLYSRIKGCKISDESARVDFSLTDDKFCKEDIIYLNNEVNKLINSNDKIFTFSHEKEPQALYWKCKEFQCPCGGTHVDNTGEVGGVLIRRKNIGKSCDRLIVKLANGNNINKNQFHD